MGLLTPDPGLLFWMVITFGVVFFILAKYGFPVILKTVEDRKAYIDNSLKAAREANEQLANVKVEGEKILAQARHLLSSRFQILGLSVLPLHMPDKTLELHKYNHSNDRSADSILYDTSD